MDAGLGEIWDATLERIATEDQSPSLDGWLRSVRPVSMHNDNVVLACPNDFARQWVEQRFEQVLRRTLSGVLDRALTVSFVTDPATPHQSPAPDDFMTGAAQARPKQDTGDKGAAAQGEGNSPAPWRTLSNRYTFDSFVVGGGNRFAHAAAKAVAESPSKVYNPLFIYGGVGLGKTHLLQAIAHHVIGRNARARVAYVSSEAFTNELIDAIRFGTTAAFRARYRNSDLLLVDDVQFLAGKEATQEEFFHTFNALHESARQIVLTSDRPPKEIPTLEERLRSRFEWGLLADIQAPDFETRVAILRKKALNEGLDVPGEVLHLIASKFESNIRELEGALVRVAALASLSGTGLNVEVASRALRDIVPITRPKPTNIQIIIRTVAEYYRLSPDELLARGRSRAVALPRQIAMYLAREMTHASLPKLGEAFGGRDHTTVLHAYEKIKEQVERDVSFYTLVHELQDKIRTL
jgi:chromosomal replication initiator protein